MAEVRLSSVANYAIAAFQGPGGTFSIVVGNIPEGQVPEVNEYLMEEAAAFFGDVPESGSAKGSVPGRWDSFVVVGGTSERVMAFIKEKLGGSPNQMN